MARTTSRSYMRHKGSADATPAVAPYTHVLSFDPTQASASLGITLPKGAIVFPIQGLGGATGGTNPTVDIGTSGDGDAFAAEQDADATFSNGVGASTGVELTEDTEVFGGVGASAATGGTFTGLLQYVMADDGTEAS